MSADLRRCVVITTYARPDGLGLLLDDLERELPVDGLDVRVYDDATPNPDPAIPERLRERGWAYRRAGVNHGKRGWWRWWNTILEDVRRSDAQIVYGLQDDMRLCRKFFPRSDALWSGIEDPDKGALYLHVERSRAELGERCWTPVRAEPVGEVVHTGWVDCGAFMCRRRLFEALRWRLRPIDDRRWRRHGHLSSGVGQQISVRAHQQGLGLYRVKRSLTAWDGGPSLMNAEARRQWSNETVGFVDGDAAARALVASRPTVFASLATIPRRAVQLRHVVERLLPQVDRLGVYLNGYEDVPRFLDLHGIEVVRSAEHGDRGDAGKFFWAGSTQGYHLICDDDLDYPEDYVERLLAGIERHGRRAVVGFHGCVLREEVADYHRSRRLLHFSRALASDTPVHVLGTGACGYHASAIEVWPKDFAAPNMADVWLALLGQRQGVPFVCLAREQDWLTELPGCREHSLYERSLARSREAGAGASAETNAVRAHGRWELHGFAGSRRPVRPAEAAATARAAAASSRPSERAVVRVRVAGPGREATLVLPARDHITEAVRRSGTYYERDLLDEILARAPGGTFVDVGAHYGNHTAFFGLECAAERVVSIEPNPAAYAGLLATVAENGLQRRVSMHRVAIHPVWRSVSLTVLPWRQRQGSSASWNSGRVGVAPASGADATPAAPLDEILIGVDRVGLVKVDAEGLSSQILGSAPCMLRRDRPLIAAEAASARERAALHALLAPLGYDEVQRRYCWTPTWLWEPRESPVPPLAPAT